MPSTITQQQPQPMPVERGHLIPAQYRGGLHTFMLVDRDMTALAECVRFSDGRVVVSEDGGLVVHRYRDMGRLLGELADREALAWFVPVDAYPGKDRPRRFVFRRLVDTTGFSGTGVAVEGVRWSHGGVQLRWLGEISSLVEWASIEEAITVHGHAGDTALEWLDCE